MRSMLIPTSAPDALYSLAAIALGSSLVIYLLTLCTPDLATLRQTKRAQQLRHIATGLRDQVLRLVAVSDPARPPTVSPSSLSSRGYLDTLPVRTGTRPIVSGQSRPRQVSQLSAAEEKDMAARMRHVVTATCERYPRMTYLGRSSFEPSGPLSLFARHRAFSQTRYYGPVLEADHADAYMNINLHPHDVKMVVEKGWGQRHPLSNRLASWVGCVCGLDRPASLPESQVFLYAPRTQSDLDVVSRIIDAAVWWVGGTDALLDEENL